MSRPRKEKIKEGGEMGFLGVKDVTGLARASCLLCIVFMTAGLSSAIGWQVNPSKGGVSMVLLTLSRGGGRGEG